MVAQLLVELQKYVAVPLLAVPVATAAPPCPI
jgi:hypothetical protein